ncbi:MAG: hypothetical protein KH230_11270 [Enterocloster asparagiformis]|nr:hypothetical protein [Enterocloster asparagiformis]
MNFMNPHQFETITEKILRIILERIKGTQENRKKKIEKHIDYFNNKK